MNIPKRLLSLKLFAIILAALSFNLTTTRAERAYDESEPRRQVNATAPVSIAEGQTLRINFFNSSRSPFEIIPCVFDGDGAHLKTWDAITLAPGQMRSFDLSRTEASRGREPGVQVRAGVHIDESNLEHLVASGEVVEDATERPARFEADTGTGYEEGGQSSERR
jgi:hypothetical protein